MGKKGSTRITSTTFKVGFRIPLRYLPMINDSIKNGLYGTRSHFYVDAIRRELIRIGYLPEMEQEPLVMGSDFLVNQILDDALLKDLTTIQSYLGVRDPIEAMRVSIRMMSKACQEDRIALIR
ncbi:MAG: hypothetical protein ACXAD7_11625 [Candidatus Kariarchaeaceae archaeon]|jgi:hypothetical protein